MNHARLPHGAYLVTSSDFFTSSSRSSSSSLRGDTESQEEPGFGINFGRPAARAAGVPCDHNLRASARTVDIGVDETDYSREFGTETQGRAVVSKPWTLLQSSGVFVESSMDRPHQRPPPTGAVKSVAIGAVSKRDPVRERGSQNLKAKTPAEESILVPSRSRSAGGRHRPTAKVVAGGAKGGISSTLVAKVGRSNTNFTRNSIAVRSSAKPKAPYRCGKCGQIKSTHLCPFKYGSALANLTSRRPAPVLTTAVNDALRVARRYVPPQAFLERRQESSRFDRNAQIEPGSVDGSYSGPAGKEAAGFVRRIGIIGAAQSYASHERESGSAPGWSDAPPRWTGALAVADMRPGLTNDWAIRASLAGRPSMISDTGGPPTTVSTTAPGGSVRDPLPAHPRKIISDPRRCGVVGELNPSVFLPPFLTLPPSLPVQDMTPSQDVRRWRQEMATATAATAAAAEKRFTLPPRIKALEDMLYGGVLEPSSAAPAPVEVRLGDANASAGRSNRGK